jgi:DNA repair photolyase
MKRHRRNGVRPGRGAISNVAGRFESLVTVAADDGWPTNPEDETGRIATELIRDDSRTIISVNDSPDVPFEQSVNPYRGCEHGCIYCYARPSHAWLGLSPGLDFESRIVYKPEARALLRKALGNSSYRCRTLTLGSNTDPYQPVEGRLGITRSLLELLAECRHPVSIVTKGSLIERDLDILAAMAADGLASVMVSITTLDESLKRAMEPRAASAARRLATLRALTEAGVPAGVLVAPVIPAINDHELEAILEAGVQAGASSAAHILLRLPHEVAGLFREWLGEHFPDRAAKVMNLLREARGGRDNDPAFGTRMTGQGPLAAMLADRFERACRRLAIPTGEIRHLDTTRFRPPAEAPGQLALI